MIWSDEFKIGYEHLDKQHQELCQLSTQIEVGIKNRSAGESIAAAMRFLVDHTRNTLVAEEQLMKTLNFPELNDHKELHSKMTRQVAEFLLLLRQGKEVEPARVLNLLIDWMRGHVLKEDKKFGLFLVKKLFKTSEMEKSKKTESERVELIAKILLLRDLFAKKQITAETVQEKKYSLLINRAKEKGVKNLRDFLDDLTYFQNHDFLNISEKKLVLNNLLENLNHTTTMAEISDPEARMVYARTVFSLKMISKAEFDAVQQEAAPPPATAPKAAGTSAVTTVSAAPVASGTAAAQPADSVIPAVTVAPAACKPANAKNTESDAVQQLPG